MNGSSIVTSGLKSSFYSIAANAVQNSLDDPRISRIAHGMSFAIGGLSLIAMSGALRYWSWCCRRENPAQVGVSQWVVAGAGLAVTIYGIYQTAMGLLEDPTLSDSCEVRLERTKQDLLSCPDAQELWTDLKSEGPFTIRCAKIGETTVNGAIVDTYKREILVLPTLNPVLKHLLFELSFLNRSKTMVTLINKMCKFDIEYFAELMEANRYNAITDTHTVSNRCVDGGFWSKSLAWAENTLSFKTAEDDGRSWQQYRENRKKGDGTNKYRFAWYAGCDKDTFSQLLKNWENTQSPKRRLSLLNNRTFLLRQFLTTDWPAPGEE